ncbi:MAG TPA: hypothetical protein VGI74_18135 [Streptosporangiaceae bacterium]|jgi:uncharacterized protein YukE
MSSAPAYTNELEQQFSRLPGFIQDVLRTPFNWVDQKLQDVAGHPDQLVSAGNSYAALGKQIQQLGTEQQQDRTSILGGGAYSGASYEAFSATMSQVEQQISSLGQSTGQTQKLLDGAAQACTQSANIIVTIVESAVSFILQDAIISGIAAFFSFGASLAAGAAAAAEKFASACEEIGGVIAKLTSVLEKIAGLLRQVASICERVVQYLRELQTALKDTKGLLNKLPYTVQRGLITAGARQIVSRTADGGAPTMPGPVGGGYRVVTSTVKGVHDVNQAESGGG